MSLHIVEHRRWGDRYTHVQLYTVQEVEVFFLTINAIAWAISPTKNCLKRLLMQSGCNCQKFRAECQWKRNERLLCVGSVSREE